MRATRRNSSPRNSSPRKFSPTAILSAGAIASFLSDSVLQGFTSAAAVLISTSQLKHLLGMKIPRAHFMETLYYAVTHIGEANPATVGVGVGGVALLLGVKRINKAKCPKIPLPEQLLLLLVATVATYAFSLDAPPFSLPILGDVPSGLPAPRFPPIGQPGLVYSLLKPTLVVGTFCFILSVSLARTFAMKFEYKIDPNQELVALGLANVCGACFAAYPASGSLSRSALVASSCGAECTPMHGVFTMLLVMLTLLLLTPAFKPMPNAVLASIVFAAVKSLFDVRRVRTLWRVKRADAVVWLSAFFLTLLLGIQLGIGLSAFISLVGIVARSSRPNHALLGQLPGTRLYRDVRRFPQARLVPGVAVFRFDASLHFANKDFFRDNVVRAIEASTRLQRLRGADYAAAAATPDGGSTPSVSATPEPTRWRPAKDAPLAPAAPSDEPPPWVRPSTVGREDDAAPSGENGHGDGLSALRDAIAPTPEMHAAPPDEAPAAAAMPPSIAESSPEGPPSPEQPSPDAGKGRRAQRRQMKGRLLPQDSAASCDTELNSAAAAAAGAGAAVPTAVAAAAALASSGAEALTERVSAVVVDCFSINDVDASALRMLRDLRKELGERKVALLLAALKGPVRDVLERDGLVGASGESVDRAFVTLHEAVKHAARLHCVRCGVARVPGANRV